jgi:hypothetical protein
MWLQGPAHAAEALGAGGVPKLHVQLAVGQLRLRHRIIDETLGCEHLQALFHESRCDRCFGCADKRQT